jgi:hypothetical protein
MNNRTIFSFLVGLSFLLILSGLAGCAAPQSTPQRVEGPERDQILLKVEPLADNLFQAMKDKNYAAFSKDFDPTMLKAIPESGFTQMMATIDPKIGDYQSRQVEKVERVGKYVAVTYTAKHALEEAVSWRLVMTPSDPMLISGIWYDSPKLRTK